MVIKIKLSPGSNLEIIVNNFLLALDDNSIVGFLKADFCDD